MRTCILGIRPLNDQRGAVGKTEPEVFTNLDITDVNGPFTDVPNDRGIAWKTEWK